MALKRVVCRSVLALIVLGWGGARGFAQTNETSPPRTSDSETDFCREELGDRSFDLRGLALIYCEPPPGVAVSLRGVHTTARPVFYGAVPAAWIGAAISPNPSLGAAAYRLTASQSLTYGLVVGIKHAVGRPRPYVDHPLGARAERHERPLPGDAHLSFPSGHASLSAALVTSWSLSHPRWYVIGPGVLWASGVTLSRVYLGVHYPSDVLAGAVLGTGVALLVHQFRKTITPSPLRAPAGSPRLQGLPVVLRVQF